MKNLQQKMAITTAWAGCTSANSRSLTAAPHNDLFSARASYKGTGMRLLAVDKTMIKSNKIYVKHLLFVSLMTTSTIVLATNLNLGTMASNITGTFTSLAKLITATSYLAGIGFAIGAIMKFKAHKDNPTQIPIGAPIALTFIAASLLFLPSILNVTKGTIFGAGGQTTGPTGSVYMGQ